MTDAKDQDRTSRPSIMGTRHVIVAGHPLAAQAGFQVLEAGGNAIDAGVAAGIALGVVESEMVSFAGVAPILLYMAESREIVTISGLGGWPSRAPCGYFQETYAGETQGGGGNLAVGLGAEALERGDPGVRRRRHDGLEDSGGNPAAVFGMDDVEAGRLRPGPEAADRHHLGGVGKVDHDRRDAAEADILALHDAERDAARDAGVNGVAARLEDLQGGLGCEILAGRGHMARADDAGAVRCEHGGFHSPASGGDGEKREVELWLLLGRDGGEELSGKRPPGQPAGAEAVADDEIIDLRRPAEQGLSVGRGRAEADPRSDQARAMEPGGEGEAEVQHLGIVINSARDLAAEWFVRSGFEATRLRALLDRRFDFVITADEAPVPPGIDVMPLMSEPFLLVVTTSYASTADSIENVTRDLDLIWFGRDPHLVSRIDRCLHDCGVAPQRRYHLIPARP